MRYILFIIILLQSITRVGATEAGPDGVRKILLTGASFASHHNGWFEIGCRRINVEPVNRAVGGHSIVNTANQMNEETLYTVKELDDIEALVIMHVHDRDVFDPSQLQTDHKAYTTPFTRDNYAISYDYVIKKYISDCYELRKNPQSRYYKTEAGKPAIIVLCTHWHDAREKFNTSIRQLARKWGLPLVEFDTNIGFSKTNPDPATGKQISLLYAKDTQTIDGIIYGWHPRRGQNEYIQQRMADIFVDLINKILQPQTTCYSSLSNDTLVIGNNHIERKFLWNQGNPITHSLTDKSTGHCWLNKTAKPDFVVTKQFPQPTNASYTSREVKETVIHPGYLEVTVTCTLNQLDIRRIYRIYDNAPAIACNTWLRGSTDVTFAGRTTNLADNKNIEFVEDMKSKPVTAILDQLNFGGQHWHIKAIEFYDVTDWNNNLVFETNAIPYRKNNYRGNLMFAHNAENDKGFFFLKEAPGSSVQLAWNGHDFTAEFGHFCVTGLGINEHDIKPGEWTSTYGCVTGVYSGNELAQLTALRSYQKNIRKLIPGRDEMIMMNTWGDRSQDSKVNEKFSLIEVERAAQLGITHFQIDDGWQVGKSPNSAIAKGSYKNIWDNPDYWKPDPVKYPRGLHPVVKRGKELGVEICLWFNPSVQHDYADWQKDAQAMIDLYKTYGIRTFKIDGLAIPTKQSEINLRKLFDTVLEKTGYNVVFNLDATAGRRGGFHIFNEYGNIFLENRYTDWQNYYPYWTLRNLWQLCKYVPAEKLQIEFLNKWRNADKYAGDPFGPANYSFEYLFATTMAGQPLAWFEGSGLPEEALSVSAQIAAYKEIQHDFHQGVILPIGEEPSGTSWTGFQSLSQNKGYLLIYREKHPESSYPVKIWLQPGTTVKCTPILGSGKMFTQTVGRNGTIEFTLPGTNNYSLYKYETIK